MRQEIKQYAFYWHYKGNEGYLQLLLADGSSGQVLLDSPAEGSLLLDVLRNEQPVYWDVEHELIMTGLEPASKGKLPKGVTDINTLWAEENEAEAEVAADQTPSAKKPRPKETRH